MPGLITGAALYLFKTSSTAAAVPKNDPALISKSGSK
jgi:hypothetical protein